MLGAERQQDIVSRIETDGAVEVAALSEAYGVTPDCIRKDLRALEKQGLLKRTYGGAVRVRVNRRDVDVAARRNRNVAGKAAIAARALELIQPGATIFLDISTSNAELARLLDQSGRPATVVTNMLDVATVLGSPGALHVIVVGGAFNSSHDGFVGSLTDEQIRRFRFDAAFMGAAGLDTGRGTALTYLPEDGLTKAAALSVSRTAYLLTETRKLTEDGDYSYASLDEFTGIILDGQPPAAEKARLEEFGLTVLLSDDTKK
ncbi:MAG: DeoR/GlpR transcriptional regulator [Clostridia bacterium]|nr:DeoR/GlpR transcriptional regulator [Clostridia bacterium]